MGTDVAGVHLELADELAKFYADPLGFVAFAFPWNEPGTILELESGPDEWQRQFLLDLGRQVQARGFDGSTTVDAIRMARGSGHGIGKSALVAWVHWWILCTRPDAKGRVTANTRTQLETTTWAEIQKWWNLLVCKDWFGINESAAWRVTSPTSWYSVVITSAAENSEAFAGQHNKHSTSFYIFDEASLIPDKIWEVAEGGLTDGEPMIFAFGNPTRNTGQFYEIGWGKATHRWRFQSIDARRCKFPNKREQENWIQDYGVDSDFCRVRILGVPPKTAESQLIGRGVVEEAQRRQVEPLPEDPLVVGVDVPDGGASWFVLRFRRGLDARPTPMAQFLRRRHTFVPAPLRFAGAKIDRSAMVTHCANVLSDRRPGYRVAAMFVDAAFGAPIVERLKAMGHHNVFEVSFGGASPDRLYANRRAWMWGKEMAEWLLKGAIDPNDTELAADLCAPGYHRRAGGDGALVVEAKADMRARGIVDIDDADALALTFAQPVAPQDPEPAASEDDQNFGRFGGGVGRGTWMGH